MSKYKKNQSIQLSKNFNSDEFDCKGKDCCKDTIISETLVKYLQLIREHFNKPITINSGYRCGVHNKKVGGASGSKHLLGMACDIVVKDFSPIDVARYCEKIGIKGIGLYDTFVHIDTRSAKSFWYSHSQYKVTSFGTKTMDRITDWKKACKSDGYKITTIVGVFDSECEKVSKKAICKKLLVGYKNKNLTKFIQSFLGIKVDGKFGKDTKNAVKKYQKSVGLTADGVVGYKTWKKMLNG